MYYFINNGEKIEKYEVSFDKQQVKNLKDTIIDKCSFIEHQEFQSDYYPMFSDKKIIRNFQSTYIGKQDYFEETREVYSFSYDRYNPPYLVLLIDKLLNDDTEVISEILNYDVSPKESIEDKINLVNKEFMEIDSENIYAKKLKLKELENLLKVKQLNQNQQTIDIYYQQLLELISFDFVESIDINELHKIEKFLGIKLLDNSIFNEKNGEILKLLKK